MDKKDSIYRVVNNKSGFFYNGAENEKLIANEAIIEKVEYGAMGQFVNSYYSLDDFGLILYIKKGEYTNCNLILGYKKDAALLFHKMGVSNCTEFNKLPKTSREIMAYSDGLMNYGFIISKHNKSKRKSEKAKILEEIKNIFKKEIHTFDIKPEDVKISSRLEEDLHMNKLAIFEFYYRTGSYMDLKLPNYNEALPEIKTIGNFISVISSAKKSKNSNK